MMKTIAKHKTLSTGVVIAIVGAAQMGLPQLQAVLPEKAFGAVGFVLGLLVAGIGAYNTMKERQAAEADKEADEAGA